MSTTSTTTPLPPRSCHACTAMAIVGRDYCFAHMPPQNCYTCGTLHCTTNHLAQPSAVEHPPHYTMGGVEVIDAIEAWGLGFHLGNAVKYIARAGKKAPEKYLEDLKKARWYLDRAIANHGAPP